MKGVNGVINIQFNTLPPTIAAIQRFKAGVVNLFVSFSRLMRGEEYEGLTSLAMVIRMEYTAVSIVAKKIKRIIRRLWLKNSADSKIRSFE